MLIHRIRELLGIRLANRLGVECNVGPSERYLRLALGLLAVAAIPALRGKKWRLPLALMAGSGLFTSLTRYCPLNTLLGIRNCRGLEGRRPEPAQRMHNGRARTRTRRRRPARQTA